MRQPLATIHGLRVGEATPARAVTPGVGSASRDARSASLSALVENRSFVRLSTPCVKKRQGRAATSRTLINADFLDGDSCAVVHAEAKRRGVLHVPRLADDDV